VSSQTIENCWRKTKIANCSNMSECIEKIKNLSIAERLKQFEYTPRQYVSVDDDEIACDILTEKEIVDIVLLKESEEILEEINEEIEPKQKMTSKDIDKSLDALLSYYEDNQALDDSILDALKILKLKVSELQENSKIQTKIDKFLM